MAGKIITIKDVAEMAGVSKATVSRVMNNSGYVAAETRRKIENIMEAHNYVPSALAVNLSRQETKVVGVVFPEIENVFYSDILHGITQVADELDLSLVLFDTQNDLEREKKAFRVLQQQKVRGIILGPSVDYPETAKGRELLANLKILKTCHGMPLSMRTIRVPIRRRWNYTGQETGGWRPSPGIWR